MTYKLATDLTESEQERFVERFYDVASFDDCFDGNPSPWGCPWYSGSDVMLSGDTIEAMAENYVAEVSEYALECIREHEEMEEHELS